MVHLLNSIGLRARLKLVDITKGIGAYFGKITDPSTRPQIGYTGWIDFG